MLKKYAVNYKVHSLDYDATYEKAKKMGLKPQPGGGRPYKSGESPEAQLTLIPKELNSKINVYPSGLIQIYYSSRTNLKKCVSILEECCISENGKKMNLECLGDEDPADTSVMLKTIDHLQPGDLKYAIAVVKLYHWKDPETDETIFRIEDRDGRVNVPGTAIRIKPEKIKIYEKKTPYRFDACIPVGIHCVDKEDSKGDRIITSEKLRWKGIQELKRIAREHPRFKPTEEDIARSIQKDKNKPKELDLLFVIGKPLKIKFEQGSTNQ
ncbi:MAG: hypothetical protein ACFFCW_50010 [Candidatus Hodarchaeota archaeon]